MSRRNSKGLLNTARMESGIIDEIPFEDIIRRQSESVLENVTYEEATEVCQYLSESGSRLRMFWTSADNRLYIKCPGALHENMVGGLSFMFADISSVFGRTLLPSGSGFVHYPHLGLAEPDLSFTVRLANGNRRHSPNMTVEVRNTNLSLIDWVRKGVSFFQLPDIQLVLMVNVWGHADCQNPNALLCFVMRRNGPGPGGFVMEQFRSFGLGPIHAVSRAYLRDTLFPNHHHLIRGNGYPSPLPLGLPLDPVCTALNMPLYQLTFPANRLLCTDDNGMVMTPGVPAAAPLAATLDLYRLQQYLY